MALAGIGQTKKIGSSPSAAKSPAIPFAGFEAIEASKKNGKIVMSGNLMNAGKADSARIEYDTKTKTHTVSTYSESDGKLQSRALTKDEKRILSKELDAQLKTMGWNACAKDMKTFAKTLH